MLSASGREKKKKKIGTVVCGPSWGESEIKKKLKKKCEWKKMEGERSHVKAKNNMNVFVLN
jgi:hypothetical protein